MANSTDLEAIVEEIAELRRQLTMVQPRMARVKKYEKGKVQLYLDDKDDSEGGGQGGGASGSSSSSSGGSSSASGSSSGSGQQGQEGKWISPWVWPGDNHVGHLREDVPYKEGQLVWVWSPNGDPNQAMIMPGPPTKEHKLPDHRDDKKVTQQIGNLKIERSLDGKNYKFWIKKGQQQGQQGGSSGSSSGQQGGQQDGQDKPKDILHHFEMTDEGGLRIRSQKQIEFVANANPDDTSKETKWTMTDGKVVQKLQDGQSLEFTKEGLKVAKGKISHDGKNIGKDHKHTQVTPGGGKTGDPDEGE